MVPLSGTPKPRRARRSLAAPPLQRDGGAIRMRLSGTWVTALPEGALWIAEMRTLVVSDLHLEKGSSYARSGRLLPPYDTRATLRRIQALIEALQPQTLVALGDSFHDRGGPARLDIEDRANLHAMMQRLDWLWIEGNHDRASAASLGGRTAEEAIIGGLILRHEPTPGAAHGEICGHLHPCARVSAGGRSVRRACFATDGARMVLPALGAFTGGLNVCDDAFAPLFPEGCLALMLGRDRLHAAPAHRLLGDG
jgi:DNA ligase-associated metallophosphoesterase